MLALLARELIVAARRPAVPITVVAIAAMLVGFVLIWSPGIPLLPTNLYQQASTLHWMTLLAAMPWVAVRSSPAERADAFVLTCALTGLHPGLIVTGKILATFGVLVAVALSGLPALVMAQQAAAVPLTPVILDVLALVGVALLTAVLANASLLLLADRLGAWLAHAAILGVTLAGLAASTPGRQTLGVFAAALGLGGAAWVQSHAARRLRYLEAVDGR
jgi:hypothetical protein